MLLVFGIVAIVVFTIQVYKTANDYGRNGVLWALATAAVGFGLQIALPVVLMLAVVLYYLATGSTVDSFESDIGPLFYGVDILGIIGGLGGMFLILKYVARMPDEAPEDVAAPPPPPTFR